MSSIIKVIVIAAARPNFMKVAPILKEFNLHNASKGDSQPKFEWLLVHTGQHYDDKMSNVFFRDLGIQKPDVNLEVGSGSHASQTANTMLKFEPVLLDYKPDWIIVVGDVNPTAACTLVATKLGIKVAHVEAGLRSFDREMPEEINRLVTDAIADLLLTPSIDANENLLKEGICDSKIELVGNVMIDSLIANLDRSRSSGILDTYDLRGNDFAYITLHRPSNVDTKDSLTAITDELIRLSEKMTVMFPIHPRTRKMLEEFSIDLAQYSSIKLLEPIGYHDSLRLTENARLIVTDSGGLQEESTYFQTPCVTVRPNTERPITITEGSNMLSNASSLSEDIKATLEKGNRFGQVPIYWDGHTASRILEAIVKCSAR